jgi:hypothetical protein
VITEQFLSRNTSQHKIVRRGLSYVLLFGLLFQLFVTISEDRRTTMTMNDLRKINDTLTLRIDSLTNLAYESEKSSGGRTILLQSKIDELNNDLNPFIKLAVINYPGMKNKDALEKLRREIIKTRQVTHPYAMVFEKKEISQIPGGHTVKIFFSAAKNHSLGSISIKVSILGVCSGRILDIWPSLEGGHVSTRNDSKLILPSGKEARISYKLVGKGRPVIEVKLSSKCTLHVEGNNDLPSFDINM